MQIDKEVLKVLNESDEYFSSLKDLWQAILNTLESKLSDVVIKGLKVSKALRTDEIKLSVFKSVNPYARSISGTTYRPIRIKLINYNSEIALFWSTETTAFAIMPNTEQAVSELLDKMQAKIAEKAQQENIDVAKDYDIDKAYIQYINYNTDVQDATYIAAWALELIK